jgi:hypothetical protein
VAKQRAALIQKVLASGDPVETGDGDAAMNWDRDDIYCSCRSPHAAVRQVERKEQN